MGHFLHAVSVFFQHLAAVRWDLLGLALACHLVRLGFRAVAWRAIVLAAYPDKRLRLSTAFGAYVAGVGVNSIVPARGGDVVKLYLVKHRLPGSTYSTLAPTLIVETLFDAVTAGLILIWALATGVLPTHQIYSRLPSVDWRFFLRHERWTLYGLAVLVAACIVGWLIARARIADFRERVRQGFAILRDPPRFIRGVMLPQALSWVFRILSVYFFFQAFRIAATFHNALLALVVDSLSTLFPATPGGAGTKQGLTEFVFRRQGISHTSLLAFSVGMNIALTAFNVLLGLGAIAVMARTLSFTRVRSQPRGDEETA